MTQASLSGVPGVNCATGTCQPSGFIQYPVLNKPSKNPDGTTGQAIPVQTGTWSGRAIEVVKEGFCQGFTKLKGATLDTIHYVGATVGNADQLSTVFKRIQLRLLPLIEELRGTPNRFAKLKAGLDDTRNTIDLFLLANDIDYFVNGHYKKDQKDNKYTFFGRIALFATNILGTAAWLVDLGVLNLSKAAKAIGNVRLFSFVPKVISYIPGIRSMPLLQSVAAAIGNVRVFSFVARFSLCYLANRALTVSFIFFGADAYQRMKQPGNYHQLTQAKWEFARCVSEVALDALVVVGVTSAIGLGLLGSACLFMAIKNFVYNIQHKKELDQPRPAKA